MWLCRKTSSVAYIYWSTKALTIINAYCKEDITVARSFICPYNIDIVAWGCYLRSERITSIVTEIYCIKALTIIIACCKEDIKVTRSVISPYNIDIVAWDCYLWLCRTTSIVTQIYWSTKGLTIINAYCKKDIKVDARSTICPYNIDIVAWDCYLWLSRFPSIVAYIYGTQALTCSKKYFGITRSVISPYNIGICCINYSRWSRRTLCSVRSSFTLYSLDSLWTYSTCCSCITFRAWWTSRTLRTCSSISMIFSIIFVELKFTKFYWANKESF